MAWWRWLARCNICSAARLLRGNKKVNFHDIAAPRIPPPPPPPPPRLRATSTFFVDFSPVASPPKCLQRPLPVHDNVRIPPHDPLLLGPRGGKGNNVVEVADIPAAGICTAQRKKPHNCNAGNGHLDTLTFPSEGSGHL